MKLSQNKIIRASRLLITCICLFLLTWYFQVPEREWSLVTVWFVMLEYSNVGGVLKKGLFRFSGTLLSAVYGLSVVYFFHNQVIINMLALGIGIFFYIYYFLDSEKSYIAVIGCVTLTIVLLNHNALDAAILRSFNIIIGIIASVFMIYFFLPEYARDDVMIKQFNMLKFMAEMLESYLNPAQSSSPFISTSEFFQTAMRKELSSFPAILDEARLETKKTSAYIQHHQQLFKQIKKMYSLLSVLTEYSSQEKIEESETREGLNHFLVNIHALKNALIGISVLSISNNDAEVLISGFSNTLVFHLNKELEIAAQAVRAIIEIDHEENYAKNVRQIYDC